MPKTKRRTARAPRHRAEHVIGRDQPRPEPTDAGTGRAGPARRTKRGAQPDNANAHKHGFYSDRFTRAEILRLTRHLADDLLSEIALQRVLNCRVIDYMNDAAPEQLAPLAAALATGTGRVARLMQTHRALSGANPQEDELKAVLTEILNDHADA